MFKKYIVFLVYFLVFNSCAQGKVSLYSKKYKIYPRINIALAADNQIVNASILFNKNFKKVTGEELNIERSNSLNSNYSYILLQINPTQNADFCFNKKGKNITIQATNYNNLLFGINEFFKKYTPLNYRMDVSNENPIEMVDEINIPNDFSECSSPKFEYREPYFSPNFDPTFRFWNKTNFLELEWGIWGHNLPKITKEYNLPETAYALVGNQRNDEQFCFTSEALFNAVNEKVQLIYDSDNALNKFMILPNDNDLVCLCNTCKSVGNTNKNAAPAVFSFMNKLAKNHNYAKFFTTAYITVSDVPNFKAESNIGVFYSTINMQKGIPLEDSKFADKFEKEVKKWSDYVKTVYIWDYATNFDNYFDIYPSLKTTQKNLKLYEKLGVKGVFIHGSEYNYSTFQELKSVIFAKLLWNPNINIDEEIKTFFEEKFPTTLSETLTNFYTFSEDAFVNSKKELSIYSGINKTTAKYLDPKVFFGFYDDFDAHTQNNKYDKEFLKIATALTFLKLEIMRDYGLGEFGYGVLKNKEIIVKNEVGMLLDKLNAYSKSAKLSTYNEVGYTIDNYIQNWRNVVYRNHKRKHYFYKKPFDVVSNLDEDYKEIGVLNDAAFGLLDYNTNWHISSIDNLMLKIEKDDVEKAEKISFSFLQDIKHRIYYPSAIEILNADKKVIKKIAIDAVSDRLATKQISLELPNQFDRNQLTKDFYIKIYRSTNEGKNAMACDEIIFN